ncbi:hypothetical protein LEP1GSC186_3810 [Leptospira noguchii serovar Autumnalis str. ZUN142]|uniref:Uncharacterized protein n=1 Tax=Leptospira noguchii serovar Autumnalis str. ZUN142 TaxID=1085540 RepID=M6UFA2_9LEPT|nr:hypothetical protein LEP1GSC186_3810 [Leptospira noguchii serovar Autumnalis str. ZUN142]
MFYLNDVSINTKAIILSYSNESSENNSQRFYLQIHVKLEITYYTILKLQKDSH